jgi:DedD protein
MSGPVSEEDFREIQLSGKQLVFLFMSTTVVLVVTFLLGVVVGRRVPAEMLVAEATGTAFEGLAPDTVGAELGQPSTEPPPPVPDEPDQFSYHERLQGTVEETVPPPPAAPPAAQVPEPEPPVPAAQGEWVAQIGAYKDRATAERIADTLKRDSFPAFVLAPTPGSPTATFRVRVGPFRERREAEAIAGRLKRERQFDSFVTR